jgi:hypothetical protein
LGRNRNRKIAKIPLEPEQEEKRRRQASYRKEQAMCFYQKDGTNSLSTNDELRYSGRANGFLIVPDELIYSGRHLSPGEKVVWLAIFSHNWNPDPTYRVSWPSRERLALILGKSVRQVTNLLAGLRRKGLLKTKRRLDKSSLYLLDDPPQSWMEGTKKELEDLKKRKKDERENRIGGCAEESTVQAEREENCTNGGAQSCS